jgi:O-antigen biosynthesis protein WbqP
MKRLFDLIFASILFVVFLLPMLLVAVLVRLTSNGSVFYWSNRVGKDGVIFSMPKFRSMKTNTNQVATHLMENPKSHLTLIGGFLRKTSLDELPQLFSVLRGDLSFVGPRPALFNQYDLIELRTDKKIDRLVPGITGWAQINGRDELSILDKVKYDEEYLIRATFTFDLKILWLTLIKVFFGRGVSH